MKDWEALIYIKATNQLYRSFPVRAETIERATLQAHIIADIEEFEELRIEEIKELRYN